jgi:hypothetical protein
VPKPWTLARLQALNPVELERLYSRAVAAGSAEGDEIAELVVKHDLPLRIGGGLTRGHQTIQAIEKVIRSPAGKAAAIAAMERGEAPMAGLDPLLKDSLGVAYGNKDTTSWAGTFAAEEAEAEGWVRKGRKSLPASCVAKTAAFFVQPNKEESA